MEPRYRLERERVRQQPRGVPVEPSFGICTRVELTLQI